MALRLITMLKVVFKPIVTFGVVFDIVIFLVVINYFQRCDICLFDVLIFVFFNVLITLMKTFDVVMVCKFFNVLFGFLRCEICSSDLFPCICQFMFFPCQWLSRVSRRLEYLSLHPAHPSRKTSGSGAPSWSRAKSNPSSSEADEPCKQVLVRIQFSKKSIKRRWPFFLR